MKEFKAITMQISYEKAERNQRTIKERRAELTFGSETNFLSIKQFLHDVLMIECDYRKCFRQGLHADIEFIVGVYEVDDRVSTKSFDTWFFNGIPDDNDGIMLTPDEKYTSANMAIWLDFKESVMRQLANYSFL